MKRRLPAFGSIQSLMLLSVFLLYLLFLPSLHAAEPICPQCYLSTLTVTIPSYDSASDTLNASAHADYWDPVALASNRPSSGGGPVSSDQFILTVRPAPKAILNFTFDGQPIMDSQGRVICDAVPTASISDAAQNLQVGNASCNVAYAHDPGAAPNAPNAAPVSLSQWPRCGLLTVRLMRSNDNAHVKPSQASAVYCPSGTPAISLYNIFGPLLLTPAFYAACLPIFIVIGLLVGSMFQQGRHPFSLFDITVPRLPSMKRVRMKPAQVPVHLAYKARMSTRIIARAEKAMMGHVLSLYKSGGKSGAKIAEVQKQVSALFTTQGAVAKRISAAGGKFTANMDALRELIRKSGDYGASAVQQNRAMGAVSRLYQLREGLALDMAVTAVARMGAKAGTDETGKDSKFGPSAKYSLSALNPRLEWLGIRLAKPWKFIPGVNKFAQTHEWMDTMPGLPYVERTAMVMQNWLGNRAGNIQMRRRLAKTAVAETLVALRMAKAPTGAVGANEKGMAGFLRKNLYQFKPIGDIPHIAERMQEESRALANAVMNEHLRVLMEAVYLDRKKAANGELVASVNADRLKIVAEMVALHTDTKTGRLNHANLATALHDYINSRHVVLYYAAGQPLKPTERDEFLRLALNTVQSARLALNDIESEQQRIVDKAHPALINPADVFRRYQELVKLLEPYEADWRAGKIPMVMLGHDLADVFGRVVNAKADARHLALTLDPRSREYVNDGLRLHHITLHMEEELRRKMRYDFLVTNHGFEKLSGGKYEKVTALQDLGGGRYGIGPRFGEWVRQMEGSKAGNFKGALDIDKLREKLQYNLRGEWAARKFLTAYSSIGDWGYAEEAERNKIDMLRQQFAFQFDRGFENFFRNYSLQVERNKLLYLSMEKLAEYYTGKPWNADTYDAWKKQGVTFGDIKKGLWLIGTERTLTPLPSGILRDANNRLVDVIINKDPMRARDGTERLTYDPNRLPKGMLPDGKRAWSINTLLFSDYADRPVNASFLFADRPVSSDPSSVRWRPGTPWASDQETLKLQQQLKAIFADMNSNPRYGNMPHGAAGAERERADRENNWHNLRVIEDRLADRVQWALRTSLVERSDIKAGTRAMGRGLQFMERVLRGGVHDTDERLNEWYASSTYARMLLEGFKRQSESNEFVSKAVGDSLEAKRALNEMRKEQITLLKNQNRSAEDDARLASLRTDIGTMARDIPRLEREARQFQKDNWKVDRYTKGVADLAIPFYNVAEMTVMRDPRIAFGGGYAMKQALMTGYQTGQFVGERPMMWAGAHLGPSDRLLNILAKPSYMAAMGYGMATRTFFTKLIGYQTVYHMDPDRGAHNQPWEASPLVAIQSLFRPTQSFDWFTRFINPFKPMVRPLSSYRDEYGYKIKEEGGWTGLRYLFPLSWKYAGSEGTSFQTDEDRWKLYGLKASDELRSRNLGLSFREQYQLWNNRYAAQSRSETEDSIGYLKSQLQSASDADEKRILRSTIRGLEDMYETSRWTWKIPLIGNFFKQGYFSVENRAGYDISATGGAHRPWEMVGAYHKAIGKAPVPGMMWTDWEDHMELFPRVARAITSEAMTGPTLAAMGSHESVTPEGHIEEYPGQKKAGHAEAGEQLADNQRYASEFEGIGRDLQRTAIREVYKRESPLFSNFMDLETERMHYSLYNTPFILPLSPLLVGGYLFWRKSKHGREQSWVNENPRERHLGEMSATEKAQEAAMLSASKATGAHEHFYACPTHGLRLPPGQVCPLCRSSLAYEQDNSLKRWETRMHKTGQGLKNWAEAAIPLRGYIHYYNQAHCPQHGVAFDRGTVCPICLSQQVQKTTRETGTHAADEMKEAAERLHTLQADIAKANRAYKNTPTRDRDEKTRQQQEIERLTQQRDAEMTGRLHGISNDKRMGYRESYAYIKKVMKDMSALDNEYEKRGFFS